MADIIASLYGRVLNVPQPRHPDRDRFVLSKGHAALALYAAFYLRGWISHDDLNTFCANGSMLGVHPEPRLIGVDFATGSLGQGLSFAVGAALAAKHQRSKRRAFALISDAECNEGSIWESIMFAAHHKLDNLFAIVDVNGQQALGYTKDVIDLSPLEPRWSAFGWRVHAVDGHDEEQIASTIASAGANRDGRPNVLLAYTTFGKGVSFMENRIKWHYSPLSDSEFQQAMAELGG